MIPTPFHTLCVPHRVDSAQLTSVENSCHTDVAYFLNISFAIIYSLLISVSVAVLELDYLQKDILV